ncbi:MAG: aminotransferase class V-fold PLP-dependent enzyme [Myxococcaceae bacterium]
MPAEVYLDNAATSFPKPESVYRAAEQFMRQGGASPARGSYVKAQESQRILIKLRSKLSQLLGISEPSNLIFTSNATDSLNLALKGYLKSGDHVVITNLEHNAVLRPLWRLRQTRQIEVTIVRSNSKGEILPDDLFKAITPKTRLIACVHASNVLGTLQPIAEISQKARELQIPFLVDGSQTTGAIPVNIEELGVDMFAFTGHKSLLGLTGTGGLFVRSELDLEPLREGGNGSHSNSLEQPTMRPERYESGTPNMIGFAGLLAGVEYLLEQGVERIRQHELELNRLLMERLENINGIVIHGPKAEDKVAITSISLNNLDTAEVGQMLGKKFGIMVRTGIHCSPLIHQNIGTKEQGTIRFSLGWANTRQDVELAVGAVQEIASAIYRRI